jgi:hypothetical protein
MKVLKLLIIILALGAFIGCSLSPTGAGPAEKNTFLDAGKALIDIPSSVTGTDGQAKALVSDSTSQGLAEVYKPAKDFTLFGSIMLSQIVRPLINAFGKDGIIPYNSLVDGSKVDVLADDSTLVRILKSSTETYMYNLDFWRIRGTDTLKMLEMSFSDDDVNLTGKIALDVNLLDNNYRHSESVAEAGNAILTIDFANLNGEKEMTIAVSNIIPDESDGCTSYKLHATKSGDIIKVSGGTHHPYIGESDGLLDSNRCYIFVANINENKDKAAVKLAFSPDTVSSSATLFTTYDIGSLFKNQALQSLLDTIQTQTVIGQLVVYSLENQKTLAQIDTTLEWLAILAVPVSKVQALTTDDIIDFMELNQEVATASNNPDIRWIDEFLWLINIEQPVYFAAHGLYIDNGPDAPDAFTDVASASYLAAFVPLDIKNLQTSFMRNTSF